MKKHLNYLNTLKKLAFKTFKLAAVSLAGVTLLAGILFLGLQTDYISQLFVLAVNKSFMQEKDLELGIRKIQGIVPFRFRIGELEIRDQSGRWAFIKDSSINLSPFDLLKGRLSFSKFHIGELKIDRSLHIRKSEHENVPRGFRIPSIMDDLSIDNLQIASMRLGKDLVGKSINLSIRGDLSNTENSEVQTLNLEIKGNDGYSGIITASVLLEGGSQSMDLKLSVHDPGKGILYSLTGMGEDFKLFVEGKGELSDWRGKLIVSGSDAGKITADIEVDSGRDYTLNVSGHFSPAEPLLKKYQLLTEKGADFKLHGAITDEDEISLNLLEIDTGNSGAGFNGRIQLSNLESEGDFHLTVGDLSILEELFKKQVKGSLLLDGTLEGFLFNPLVELTYSIKEFGIDSIKSEEIRGSGIIDLQYEGSSGKTVNISGDGNIYGLLLELKKSKYSQEKIGYRFNLSGKPKENLEINLLNIDSETLTAQASGNADFSAGKLTLEGNIEIADPSGLYPLKEGPLMGSGNLDFMIDADMSPVKVNTFIEGVYKPVPKDQFLKNLAGDDINFKGSAAFNGKEFEFSEIRIEALNASLESSGIYDPKEGADFSGSINIPDLGEVAGYRKKTLQGRAKAEYSINGIMSSLEISASVDVKDFLWGEIRVAGASGEIAGTHTGQSDKGEISIELINDGYRIKSRSEFLLSGNKAALKNISISGADTEFAGNIDIDTRTPSVNGKLDFNSDDISSIAELLGKEMKGAASGEINFSSPAEKPDIEYSAFVQNLVFQKHSIKNIDLSGSIWDIFNDLEFKTQASLKGYTHEKIILETVDINAQGEKEKFNIGIKGSGNAGENLNIEASALFENNVENKIVRVENLKAGFGSTEVKVIQPLHITYSDHNIFIENVNIGVNSGGISGYLKYTGQELNGDFSLENIPLNTLYLAGAPLLDGTLTGSLKLEGSLSMPDISSRLNIDGIRRKYLKNSDIPPLSIKAEYSIRKESFKGKLTLGDLTGSFTIPCEFSIYPFSFKPVSARPVSGKIRGGFELAVIPALFEVQGQIITGRLETDFDLDGKYDSLKISGNAALSSGRYENPGMGLLFNNIQADISAENSQFVLRSLKADDGREGTVTGDGAIDVDMKSLEDFPYSLNMKLKDMRLIDNDRLSAVASGDTEIKGAIDEHKITGNLTLERAEFQIPEKLPVEVAEIDIKEINQKKDEVSEEKIEITTDMKMKFDLSVSSPGRVYIRGRGLDSEWKGDIELDGASDGPLLSGNFILVRGRYDFVGKSFVLTKGKVTFSGNTPPDPYFDITGEYVTGSVTAYINLRGSIKNPEFNVSSDPVLPEDEILARVLFGRDISQITSLQALQLAAALREMFGGKKGFDPLSYTRNLMGIDRLEVKQSQANPDETALSAGKYLNEDIYIEVEKGTTAESGEASVTWELNPNITVETEVGEDSESGVGINWKYDY